MILQKIEKEDIAHLHFLANDVIADKELRKERERKLARACLLGNLDKQKCRIFFCSEEGHNYVETTIWAITDLYVCLKGDLVLLKTSIEDVIL